MPTISRSEFKRQIQEMDPTRFEHFVADLWSAQGWNTRVTREQGDRGIDIVATRDNPVSEKHLIQAKRYGSNNIVGSPDVQQYASLRQQEQAVDAVVIVTSSRFSEQAEDVAADLNVKIVDGDSLYDLVSRQDAFHIVEDYLSPGTVRSSSPPSSISSSKEPTSDFPPAAWLSEQFETTPVGRVYVSLLLLIVSFGVGTVALAVGGESLAGVAAALPFWAGYLLLIFSIYQDTNHLRQTADWRPNTSAWIFAVLFFHVFAGIFYVIQRRNKL